MEKVEYNLDQIDLQILRIMQQNARTNNADIARELGMAPSAILERVKKLEHKSVILDYHTHINPDALDQKMLSFIFIKSHDNIGDQRVGLLLAKIPEVLEVHDIAGDDGYLIKVRTSDSSGLVDLMRNTLSQIDGIISTRTTIVLETVKESHKLVIPS
ncbi:MULTISPECIES: Lrp/AsnC family transcriptional regulator [Sphingobacterium]|uniref:Lrp/AsnC family transcriptional regulator n=1 Tax=Sphingobacterium populi TaxID=1812824 RepID=A0ABW5UAK8_9SPHI|nr:Lrp/AsnC family transcriptional regulator [Sphingobacterium sp. CFCC 11742]